MRKRLLNKLLINGITFILIATGFAICINGDVESTEILYNDVLTFYPSDDTFVAEQNPDHNPGSYEIHIKTRGLTDWHFDSLIKFNVSSISVGTNICSAKLRLYYYDNNDGDPVGHIMNLYRILDEWNETNASWNNQPSHDSIVSAFSIVPSSTGVWMEWDVTSDVQNFIDGYESNYGWKLIDNSSGSNDMTYFYSKEYGSYLPYLEIEFADVYVDDDAEPSWYDATHVKTIQEGIDNATIGDTVYVYNGTYFENVIINKTINLTGEYKKSTIIDGGGSGKTIYIDADLVNITRFTIRNNNSKGIYLDVFSDDNIISNCSFLNNSIGIYPYYETDRNSILNCDFFNNSIGIKLVDGHCDIYNCIFFNNSYLGIKIDYGTANIENSQFFNNDIGIKLDESEGSYISNCEIFNCTKGIELFYSPGIISNCTIYNHTYGIYGNQIGVRNCNIYNNFRGIWGSIRGSIVDSNIFNNTDIGIPMFYRHFTAKNCNVYNNGGCGIKISTVENGNNNAVINCSIYNNSNNGIYLYSTHENIEFGGAIILNNSISNNFNCGIYMIHSVNATIKNNRITREVKGIFSTNSGDNTIVDNYIYNNSIIGIEINDTSTDNDYGNNEIYHNNLFNNQQNAYDNNLNVDYWDDGYPSGGNYWDDYTGLDFDCDGIGDTPYDIPGGSNQDLYPLIHPFGTGNVGCWHFDEGNGTIAYDSSGSNNHGTIHGASWTIGINGSALDFDGVYDHVSIPKIPQISDVPIDEITIEGWILLKSNNGIQQFIEGLTSFHEINIETNQDTSELKFDIIDNFGILHNIYSEPLSLNNWHHVVGTFNGSVQCLYIDGILEDISNWTNPVTITSGFTLGKDMPNPSQHLNGIIDEVSIYNYALNANEILTHYQKYFPPTPTIVYVDDDFNISTYGWQYDHFNLIQDGVDAVNESGTVFVYCGTYNEWVEINKTIELRGEDRETTIIDGTGLLHCLRATSDTNNVIITNLTAQNAQSIGVNVWASNSIVDNVTSCWNTNDYGFYIREASNITIKNCLGHNNERGIFDRETDGLEVYDCTFRNNTDWGMNTYFATTNAYIHHNNFLSNVVNVEDVSDGSNLWDYNYYDDYTGIDANGDGIGDTPYDISGSAGEQDLHPLMNPIISPPIFVWVDDDYNASTPGWQYGYFDSVQDGINAVEENCTIYVYNGSYTEDLDMWDKKNVSLIGESMDNVILNRKNWIAFILVNCTNITIKNFNLSGMYFVINNDNTRVEVSDLYVNPRGAILGIEIFHSNQDCEIHHCHVTNSTYGISEEWPQGNPYNQNTHIHHNNIFENINNVRDNGDGSSIWEYNYYDDYLGIDNDGDGIGETPYPISGGSNQDLYPFTNLNGWLYEPPIASFTYSPSNPTRVDTIQFNETSYDIDDNITTYSWEFGDGFGSYLQNPTHQYTDIGTYLVNLTVTDEFGYWNKTQQTITVINIQPKANYTHYPLTPGIGEEIQFNDTSIDLDGSISSWNWNFGDGYSSSLQNPTYDYDDFGIYPVTLEAADNDGSVDIESKLVLVDFDLMSITNLTEGWNFVSAPYNFTMDSNEFIIKYNDYYYNWTQSTNPAYSLIIDPNIYGWDRGLDQYISVTNLEPGFGYWIYAYQTCEIFTQYDIIPVDNYITDLNQTWNIIGIPQLESVNLTDLIVQCGGTDYSWEEAIDPLNGPIVDPNVYGWDSILARYEAVSDMMEPGYAYWIYAYEDCELKR